MSDIAGCLVTFALCVVSFAIGAWFRQLVEDSRDER